jgi:hypothetical protein
MALTKINPAPARVRWDRESDRPTQVRWDGRDVEVTRLKAVRDERHAYHRDQGPRLTLVVETTTGSAVVVYDASAHHWFVEAVDLAA